jgi:cell division protein FtsW
MVSLAYGVGMTLALTRQRPSTEMASIGDANAAGSYA